MANTIKYVVQTLRSGFYHAFTRTNDKNLHIWRFIFICGSDSQSRGIYNIPSWHNSLLCVENKCKNSLQKERELFQSGNVHSGKTIPFPIREFPKCSLCILQHLVYAQSKPGDVDEFPSLSRETGAYPSATPTE